MADELNNQYQGTQGHEQEVIKVEGLKASLQKMKDDLLGIPNTSEAVKYTQAEADAYNALLTGALDDITPLTAEQATAYNTAIAGATKEAGDTLSEAEANLYNATLDGAVTTDDVKTPAVPTKVKDYVDTEVAKKYTKPTNGIPKSDLASGVKTSLGKADTSVQGVAYDTTKKKITETIGSDTTDVVTAYKIVEDGGGIQMKLLDLFSLAHDYSFKKNDALLVGGAIYKATADTTAPPFDFVFDANNSIVVERINGYDSPVVDNDTLNAGWEKVVEINDRYYVEQRVAEEKSDVTTTLKTQIDALTRHTRLTDFDLNVLKQAVAAQNLEKYGLKVGDQKTINGHTYVIAGLNPMKGTDSKTVTVNHVGLIVIPHTTQAWNASGNTYTGADSRGAGYMNSDLHYYLKNTLLSLVNTDLGSANLLGHYKLLSSSVSQNGPNRIGGGTAGCSSSWLWENCKICALSEMQVYGSTILSSSGFDTGEADQQLEVFKHYKHTEIFGDETLWLRDVVSATEAATAGSYGVADYGPASSAKYLAAIVLFH